MIYKLKGCKAKGKKNRPFVDFNVEGECNITDFVPCPY